MTRTSQIGIMQGRLSKPRDRRIQSFPRETWRKEFDLARDLGFDMIEIVFEHEGYEQHPLWTEEGRGQLQNASRHTGVRTLSICADFFMAVPLHHSETRDLARTVLDPLIHHAHALGIRDIVLPCVDQSSLASPAEEAALKEELRRIHPLLDTMAINLALETDLNPMRFKNFLDDLHLPHITVNYDTGNSAGLGYSATEELASYGRYISSVHIKDRMLHGTTVAFGTGHTDFPAFFTALKKTGYAGSFIIQGARGDNEREVAQSQLRFTRDHIEKYFLPL